MQGTRAARNRGDIAANMALVERMKGLTGRNALSRDQYEDVAITAARLAKATTDILTAMELHRTAQLCAMAADMTDMAKSEGKLGAALGVAFNRGRDFSFVEVTSQDKAAFIEFEAELRKVARFRPPLPALLRGDEQASNIVAALAMAINSEPDEKVIPMAIADLGVAGLFRRGGESTERPRESL